MSDNNIGLPPPKGFIVAIVGKFLSGPLSILVLAAALAMGLAAVLATPREEEPQIVVPMADVLVDFPGHSAEEVEHLVTTPLERLMWQIDGVEHVYSISRRDQSMVTVRFYVGQDRDRAMVKIRDKIDANLDLVPPGVRGWLVKPVEIDDVPILTLTLFSKTLPAFEVRRVAEEVKARMDSARDISLTQVTGGQKREMIVEADVEAMAARGVTIGAIGQALQRNNAGALAGEATEGNVTRKLLVRPALASREELLATVVSQQDGRIVRVEDVARVLDGPSEPESYVHLGFGPAALSYQDLRGQRLAAVTLSFSKKKGTNAVAVAENLLADVEKLKGSVIPTGVEMLVTRNYGALANEKVNDLLGNLVMAIVTVVVVLVVSMGWREALVVALSVPVSFALAMFVNLLAGYTINRVTLFALILSLGLVVDDPITNVDNIQRHLRMKKRKPFEAALEGVREVLPPVIMSTLTIIVSFLPMFFITGMMGPYMGPMAINVPLAVTFSTVCALTFVPWLAFNLLKGKVEREDVKPVDPTPAWVRRFYRALVSPFLSRGRGVALLCAVVLMLAGAAALAVFRLVPLKMLPFDNKDELQLVVDMPEGTSLEMTDAAVQALEADVAQIPEVMNFQSYVGVSSPIDFNGLVRHYGMRTKSSQADIRINLLHKSKRSAQSHAIAMRIRDRLTETARRHKAKLSIVEVPPGPPVISTITVEVGGRPDQSYGELIEGAKALEARLAEVDPKYVAQIDDMSEMPHERLVFEVDRDRAAEHGLAVAEVEAALRHALDGAFPGLVHVEGERTPLLIRVRLPLADRSTENRLGQLWLQGQAKLVQLAELGRFRREIADQPIYHKNLERVVFVTAETVGRAPGEVILDTQSLIKRKPLPAGIRAEWAGEGEWEITVRVFRDLGIAFGVAMIGIYLLLVIQMRSFGMPVIVMMAIPLTAIGIMPGFYLLNVVAGGQSGGYPDPVFFTATAMIGMIALGGIVIRNSLVLIEFVQEAMARGESMREAILASGAVRFRPIMLTALTTVLGAWPITLDPIFSGLAWALIFGLVASTLFTLVVIPTVYMMVGPKIAPVRPEA